MPELTQWMGELGKRLKLKLDSGDTGGVSLSDYLATDANVAPLESPRSLHVCLKEGIDPESLKFKEESTFKSPGVPDELVKMSFEHHEQLRLDRLRSLVGQRDRTPANQVHVPAFLPGGGKKKAEAGLASQNSTLSALGAEKSAMEAARAAERAEKAKQNIEAQAKEMQAIQMASSEKAQKNKIKQEERKMAMKLAAEERTRAAYEKQQQALIEVRKMEAQQRADAAKRFEEQEAERQEQRRIEKAAKKEKEAQERAKREKEAAWRAQMEATREKQEAELYEKYQIQAEEERKRTEAFMAKKLAAADKLEEKKAMFEQKKRITQQRFDEQMKARIEEFEKNRVAAEERAKLREKKAEEEHARRVAKGVENDEKRIRCYKESEAKIEARRTKLLTEQEELEKQVVSFAHKSQKELSNKVMQKKLKSLERIEIMNARERALAFKREVVRAELSEKMERAEELKKQRARIAEERRMANIKHAQQASFMRSEMESNTLKIQRDLFVDTHKRVKELANTLASQKSGTLPKI